MDTNTYKLELMLDFVYIDAILFLFLLLCYVSSFVVCIFTNSLKSSSKHATL